jgi:hypothetical protein
VLLYSSRVLGRSAVSIDLVLEASRVFTRETVANSEAALLWPYFEAEEIGLLLEAEAWVAVKARGLPG